MLWTLLITLLMAWLVGFILFEGLGLMFHILLAIAAGFLFCQLLRNPGSK